MNKDDLKTGMVVESRAGSRGLVMISDITGFSEGIIAGCGQNSMYSTWGPLSNYTHKLQHTSSNEYDIVKVFKPESNRTTGDICCPGLVEIWSSNDSSPVQNINTEIL